MHTPTANPKALTGCATERGTDRFRSRFAAERESDFFRPLNDTLQVSSLGVGTYLGETDDATDRRYIQAIRTALKNGINLIDSAINYRCQRSERCVGAALRDAVGADEVKRDETVVCTKGGYIPLEGQPPPTRRDYEALLRKEYFDRGIMSPDDVVAGGHCLAAPYLADQIRRSRRNLGVRTIDIYYLHNPEQQLDVLEREVFLSRIHDAFAKLEQAVAAGDIGCYGCATWNGFRVGPDTRSHLELEELVAIAREVGGPDHHFRVIQLPVNLAMTEAIRAATQRIGSSAIPLLQAAAEVGVAVVASAPLMQGQLVRGLPQKLRDAFPALTSDAQCAVSFVRGLPSVTTTLVGMKSPSHLQDQLAAVARRN
jgi:aryl-alcohol dehydrogenase-like predicted oxidoreductase